jgi:hypothetical protein
MNRPELEAAPRRPRFGRRPLLPVLVAAVLLGAGASAAQEERRIVSIADIHGALGNFTSILQEVGLVDDDLRWSGGDTVFVQTGDILDRGPEVREALDLLMRLQEEAPRFGGEVIVVFGNHEAMNLVGHLRDTTAEDSAAFADASSAERRDEEWKRWTETRVAFAESIGQPQPRFDREAWEEARPLGYVERMDALGPDGVYGRWLRQLPAAVRIDNLLFMHAGLNPAFADLTVDEINERVSGELQRFDATKEAMVDAGLITPYADLVEMITIADQKLGAMIQEMDETGERPDAEGQELARTLDWMINYTDWQLLTREGLLWFRGLAQWPEEEHAAEVAEMLDKQDIDHIVVGHTVQADGDIRTRFDGGVFLTDTGMLEPVYHGRPSALEIHAGKFTARYVGESEELLSEPVSAAARAGVPAADAAASSPRVVATARRMQRQSSTGISSAPSWIGPDGSPLPFAREEDVLRFLRSADVVSIEDVGDGKTQPRRVVLADGEVRARAIFHTVDIRRQQVRIGDRFHAVFRDSWRSQIAAYRVARLLGLDNVAPTVERRIDDETGSLQLWLENEGLRTNADRVRAGQYPADVASWLSQEWSMHVFDALIFNDDRHAENILVDDQWKLWMIDHTRAFQSAREIRDLDKLNRIERQLLESLRLLDGDSIAAAVGDLLAPDQVNAILLRRDAILEHFGRLIDIEGEAAVVYDRSAPSRLATIDGRVA